MKSQEMQQEREETDETAFSAVVMPPARHAYRPELDGLRAVAVVSVIMNHAGFSLFEGGYVGVDVFFVLSGFLVTCSIVKEAEAGNFTLSGFYERRARRILPMLLLTLAGCYAPARLYLLPVEWAAFVRNSAWAALGLQLPLCGHHSGIPIPFLLLALSSSLPLSCWRKGLL
jgi:peptidoglycan/LPS O-acetylase OafA/YrhL